MFNTPEKVKIAIVGLGYVGLPLAVEFATKYPVTGLDLKQSRVDEINNGIDSTLEIEGEKLRSVLDLNDPNKGLHCSNNIASIADSNIYIIVVPTPTDQHNRPDLSLIIKATRTVAGMLKEGDVVIYESTVYPGCTEEVCVPLLEEISGLKFNIGFFAGYSPERINPGDKVHQLTNILKVTSGFYSRSCRFY